MKVLRVLVLFGLVTPTIYSQLVQTKYGKTNEIVK